MKSKILKKKDTTIFDGMCTLYVLIHFYYSKMPILIFEDLIWGTQKLFRENDDTYGHSSLIL